jgi:dimeric dUTPase (all-alpha-NTP-PPase superfamily)
MNNLQELYKIQASLKERIGYTGDDKFERMILAMIIEFAEAANDWQKFKYWKKNNDPKLTLLEELSDGLHFILEAGLDLLEDGYIDKLPNQIVSLKRPSELDVTGQFKQVFYDSFQLEIAFINGGVYEPYITLFGDYLRLVEMLGFTDAELATEYLKKNRVNFERQENNY